MASEIIGLGPCINCTATVEYRMNVAGRAFYRCNGSSDPNGRACGLEVKCFGKVGTEAIVKALTEKKANAVQGRKDDGGAKRAAKKKPATVEAEDGDGDGSGDGSKPATGDGSRDGHPYYDG